MKQAVVAVAAAVLALPAAAAAQSMGGLSAGPEPAGPLAAAMAQLWQRADHNMPAAAELPRPSSPPSLTSHC